MLNNISRDLKGSNNTEITVKIANSYIYKNYSQKGGGHRELTIIFSFG